MYLDELTKLRQLDILSLGMRADEVRRARTDGGVVTYLRVHAVDATQIVSGLEIPAAAAEVRLHQTPKFLDEAINQIRILRDAAGTRRIAAFSLADLEERAKSGWGPISGVITQLSQAGLSDLTEIAVDQVDSIWESMWMLVHAGLRPSRLTVARPLDERWEAIFDDVSDWAQHYRTGFRFAPLPRVMRTDKPTTGYEDVRMVALSRLMCDDEARYGPVSIEVDWSLYGPKLAQVALTFGADHLDAVSAASDPGLGPRRQTIEDVERNIRAAGFEPREYRP
jgi:CofH/MqnC-like protein